MKRQLKLGRAFLVGASLISTSLIPVGASAQWVQENEQFYLPAEHNWVFRQNYSGADRLFNAFDYGHAILYETLYRKPDAPASELEVEEYNFLTQELLKRPPRVPLEEGAIEIAYAKIAPEAKLMFEWAHLLHRQIYDVLADERLSQPQKDAEVAELVEYYKSRPDLAFSSQPKSMDVMDGQFYSLAFREKYPKFNGLIWAYHWLQVGLYEPLMVNVDASGRSAGVNATVGRFWQMLEDAPETMPYLMPMTGAVAPTFAARYPEPAIIFDNLHMLHDIISDVLTSPEVPRSAKRQEILAAADLLKDDTAYAISFDEWRMMPEMMGLNNMGGPSVNFSPELPAPTVSRGMSMAGMNHGGAGATATAGTNAGQAPMAGMQHGNMPMPSSSAPSAGSAMDHSAMPGMAGGAVPGMAGMQGTGIDAGTMATMMAMHARMMEDPVIRERMATDPVLQRMMANMAGMSTASGAIGGVMPTTGQDADDRRAALEFIVILLSDPEVAARVHADPALHLLWSDPEVQARLQELQQLNPQSGSATTTEPPSGTPAPAAPEHLQH